MDIIQYLLTNYSTFMFVFARTGGVLLMAPVFGAMNVPMQVKAGLSLLVSLLLTPLAGHVELPATMAGMVLGLAGEILIGVSLGLCIRFIFTGIEFAGQVSGFQMGIGMASAYDPMNSAQITVLGRMLNILTILIFLSINGHLMILMALGKSFEIIPPYGFHLSGALMEGIFDFSRSIFVLAVKFSAPVIAILIFVNLALGIMARTVPQLNMFVIGFAVTMMAGFIVLALSMPVFEGAVMAVFDSMWEKVFGLMRVM